MSWRFRKSFKVIPGVKLNLTPHGLSATLGAAPLSVNIGPRGVYSNVSVPGTGLWNRTRLDTPGAPVPETLRKPMRDLAASEVHEIRSASTERLNSANLEQLRKVVEDTYEERVELTREIAKADNEARDAASRFERWERGFLFKRLFKTSFQKRQEANDTAQAHWDELNEQLRQTTIAAEMNLEPEQAELYFRMRDEFAAASESQRIWDTLTRRSVNRVAERSAANEEITRAPVKFSLDTCDLIQWDQKVPHLENRTGGDLYIYPGFVLYRASKQAFALIESKEIVLIHREVQFIEAEQVPSDARLSGRVWAKANKDGTPDRRFRDNYQIPLVVYASWRFTSPSGLEEEFQLSNPNFAGRFGKAWDAFHSSFANSSQTPQPATPDDPQTAFANESERARELATKHEEFWYVALVEELLRSKVEQLIRDYDNFDAALRTAPTRCFNGRDYMSWLLTKTNEPIPMINRLADCVNRELAGALKAGQEAEPVLLLRAVNDIIARCSDFIRWEFDICSAEPPPQLISLGLAFRGFSRTVIGDVARLRDEFTRITDGARKGTPKFGFHLEFSTPPQVKNFIAEMDKAKKHPEWLAL